MRHRLSLSVLAAGLAAIAASPAGAKCTRLAFSVNDYGKEGPAKDAKALLDKYIAQKMAEKGIKQYHTGKKDVNCELFLNFILFDEHTCKAEATVCWSEPGASTTGQAGARASGRPAAVAHSAHPAAKAAGKTAARKPAQPPAAPPPVQADTGLGAPAAPDPGAGEGVPSTEAAVPEIGAAPDNAGGENPAPSSPGTEGEAGNAPQAAEAAPAEGPVEKFAAPAKIIIPEPIKIQRGGTPAPKTPQEGAPNGQ